MPSWLLDSFMMAWRDDSSCNTSWLWLMSGKKEKLLQNWYKTPKVQLVSVSVLWPGVSSSCPLSDECHLVIISIPPFTVSLHSRLKPDLFKSIPGMKRFWKEVVSGGCVYWKIFHWESVLGPRSGEMYFPYFMQSVPEHCFPAPLVELWCYTLSQQYVHTSDQWNTSHDQGFSEQVMWHWLGLSLSRKIKIHCLSSNLITEIFRNVMQLIRLLWEIGMGITGRWLSQITEPNEAGLWDTNIVNSKCGTYTNILIVAVYDL